MADSPLPPLTEKLKRRFWAKVERRGPDDCWVWTASKDSRGYGRLAHYINSKRTLPVLATHIALELDERPRPPGAFALHTCDNPSCVNPAHLRWGTAADNVQDMFSRKRNVCRDKLRATMRQCAARGSSHVNAKLTEADIKAIRADTRIGRLIAVDYGLTAGHVNDIKRRAKWAHVT